MVAHKFVAFCPLKILKQKIKFYPLHLPKVKPVSMTFDTGFEEMSNPDKFPFGTGGFNTERPVHLTYRKYFNQRLLNVDGFFCDLEYLFVAEYIVAQKQIFDGMHNLIWRQKPYKSGITASQTKDPKSLGEYVRKDKA